MSCTKRLIEINALSQYKVLFNYLKPPQKFNRDPSNIYTRVYRYQDSNEAMQDIQNVSNGYCFRCGHVDNCLKKPPLKYHLYGKLTK
jgi:hypothetical protein